VRRAKGSSTLVVLLIGLPIIALSGAAVFAQSHIATPEQKVTLELGHTQAMIAIAGGPDPSRVQAVNEPGYASVDSDAQGRPLNADRPAPEDPGAVIPAGTTVLSLMEHGAVWVDTAGGTAQVPATAGPAWDPALEGRFWSIAGASPRSGDEAMVSPGLLDRIGAKIGDRLTLTDTGRSFTITGTMSSRQVLPDEPQVFLPASARDLVPGTPVWFTVDWQPDYADFQEMSRAGFRVYARDLALHPPAGALIAGVSSSFGWMMLLVGAVAAAFCGYLVVLLAGAAFAVAARRQQRFLAVTASVGAVRGDVFRIVLLQGSVLGLVAGTAGAAIGIGLAQAALTLTDRGAPTSFWGNWGLQIPWMLLVGIVAFSVAVGTIAAIAPARTATRGDVLGALRGARRPARLKPRRPLWGLGLMILGLAATIVGAVTLAAMNAVSDPEYASPARIPLVIAVVTGPLVFQIGVIIGGHWTLTVVSRALTRLGLAARIASRDAAANPSRVIPAFAAIAACVFIASFTLSTTAMTNAANRAHYSWLGHPGTVAMTVWNLTADDAGRAADAMRALMATSRPERTVMLRGPATPAFDPDTGRWADPDAPVWTVAETPPVSDQCSHCAPEASLNSALVFIVDPADVATATGEPLPEDAHRALVGGGAVVLKTSSGLGDGLVHDGAATLVRWRAATQDAYNEKLGAYHQGAIPASDLPRPEHTLTLPAVTVAPAYPQGLLQVLISTETAHALGMQPVPHVLLAEYAQPPGDDVVDALTAAAESTRITDRSALHVQVERGPASIDPVLWLISGVAMVLVIGAGTVCLGLARYERRADDATLAAVGAGRGLRRRVEAWQAVIVVGLGTVIGSVAGLIPTWGISQMSGDYLDVADTPWLWLALSGIGLPLVMAAASWLIPPRSPDLTRRTAIA
jgi:hypothetical protein